MGESYAFSFNNYTVFVDIYEFGGEVCAYQTVNGRIVPVELEDVAEELHSVVGATFDLYGMWKRDFYVDGSYTTRTASLDVRDQYEE